MIDIQNNYENNRRGAEFIHVKHMQGGAHKNYRIWNFQGDITNARYAVFGRAVGGFPRPFDEGSTLVFPFSTRISPSICPKWDYATFLSMEM